MRSALRLRRMWLPVGALALAPGCILAQPAPDPVARPLPAAQVHARGAQATPSPLAPDAAGDVRVVFDSERGVHVVQGMSDRYWDAGRYYRVERGKWLVSDHVEGPWVRVEQRDVPLALVRAAASKDVYPARLAD